MRNKTLFVSAVLLAALWPWALAAPPLWQNPRPRCATLNVNGTGQVFLRPILPTSTSVCIPKKPLRQMLWPPTMIETQKVIDALKDAGVDAKDIRTTNFSIWPNTQYGPDGQPTGTRYAVDNSVFCDCPQARQPGRSARLRPSLLARTASTASSSMWLTRPKRLKKARDAGRQGCQSTGTGTG